MKHIFNKTTYSVLILVVFASGIIWAKAAGNNIPLNSAPFVKAQGAVTNWFRGQTKEGQLTVGSATPGSSTLTVVGSSGLLIKNTPCVSGTPCAYTIPNPSLTAPDLRVLQGGYLFNSVVGAPNGTTIAPGASLDVHGTIKADPANGYLTWGPGAFYHANSGTSTTDKPICATQAGDLIVCGTSNYGTTTGQTGTGGGSI